MTDRFTPDPYRFRPRPERFAAQKRFGRMRSSWSAQTGSTPQPNRPALRPSAALAPSQAHTDYVTHGPTEARSAPVPYPAPAEIRRILDNTLRNRPEAATYLDAVIAGFSPQARLSDRQVPVWAGLCHLSSLIGFIVPWGNLIFPAILWRLKRKESRFIGHHGLESLNFQLTIEACKYAARFLFYRQYKVIQYLLMLYAAFMAYRMSQQAGRREQAEYPLSFRLLKQQL